MFNLISSIVVSSVLLAEGPPVNVWTGSDPSGPCKGSRVVKTTEGRTFACSGDAWVERADAMVDVAVSPAGSLSSGLGAVPSSGGIVGLHSGTFSVPSTISLKDFLRVEGAGPNASRLNFTGTGKAFDFQSTTSSNTTLSRFYLHGSTGSGDHCVEWRNDGSTTSSASYLQMRDLKIDNCPSGKAAIHFLGIKPAGGEGNVYGGLMLNVHADSNYGHGVWLDSQSAAGAAGTALTNFWASSASGNQGYGLFADTSNAPDSRHGTVNIFGSLLQGNSLNALRLSSVSNLNLIGSYFEQTNGASAISASGAVFPNSGLIVLGNNIGNINPSPQPDYSVEFGGDSGWGSTAVLSAGNTFSPTGVATYSIKRLNGAILGPDNSPSGTPYVDWAGAWGWKLVQVFDANDGSWSFSSDGTYSDQPHIGFGVTNPAIAAYLHVAGRVPPSVSTAGTNAFPVLKVVGPKGGSTSGAYAAGNGSAIDLTAGDGGNGVTGSTTGNGGSISLTPGAKGTYTGSGSYGTDGHVIVNRSVGQGTGLKHGRVTTGSIATHSYASVVLTWSGAAFADTSYTVACSVEDASASGMGLVAERVMEKTTTTTTVQLYNNAPDSLTGNVGCIAMHD